MPNSSIEFRSHKPMSDEQSRIKALIQDLGDFNDARRLQARQSLVRMGKPVIPALIETLQHANHLVRWGAAKALTEIRDPSTADVLVKVLEDDVFDIRWIASEGLIGMGVTGLIPLLKALVEHADLASLRESARHVVRVLSDMGMGALLCPVLEAIDCPDPSVNLPLAAEQALEKLQKMPKSKG